MRLSLSRQCLLLILPSLLLTGCMVGPNFHAPEAPAVKGYTETALPKKTAATPAAGKAGKSQTFVYNRDIPAEWWALFHSPGIDELIRAGLTNSPNLASACAALRQAKENLNVQIGNSLFPAFNLTAGGERQRFAGASLNELLPSDIFNTYNTNVGVSYNLDIFGGSRREIESLRAQVDYQQYQVIAAYLSLTSNIVTTAVATAAIQAQIQATQGLLTAEEGQLRIMRKQYAVGGVSMQTIYSQESLVEETRATLPPLDQELSQDLHALSVLVGAFPDAPLLRINFDSLTLPAQVPVSLPSNLVRQRPDVMASEALLHSANAQIGVATANLLPQITLTGNYGWQSSVPSGLFKHVSNVWSIAGDIAQPIFHGGALAAQRRAAIAAHDQAAAQYQQTVLQAFQNVADSLRAVQNDARTLRAKKAAEIAARKNLTISTQQYRLGGVDYLTLLSAQQQYQKAIISRIQAQAARYNDTAALFQALGGGWWNRAKTQDNIQENTQARLSS